jgi:hypothetical protein
MPGIMSEGATTPGTSTRQPSFGFRFGTAKRPPQFRNVVADPDAVDGYFATIVRAPISVQRHFLPLQRKVSPILNSECFIESPERSVVRHAWHRQTSFAGPTASLRCVARLITQSMLP